MTKLWVTPFEGGALTPDKVLRSDKYQSFFSYTKGRFF